MRQRIPLLILGLGSTLCSDDGAGIAALDRLLNTFELPEGVVALDGGTLGLSLLPYLEDADTAILIDAVQADAPPGSVVRLEGEAVTSAARERLSVHQVGVADLLDGARWLDRSPSRVVLVGVVPATTEVGFGCSPNIQDALRAVVAEVADEARALGFPLRPRHSHEPVPSDDPHRGAGLLGV